MSHTVIDFMKWRPRNAVAGEKRTPACRWSRFQIECPDEIKFEVIEQVRDALQQEGKLTGFHNGVQNTGDAGTWFLRVSYTRAALVVRLQSHSEDGLMILQDKLAGRLKQFGLRIPESCRSREAEGKPEGVVVRFGEAMRTNDGIK